VSGEEQPARVVLASKLAPPTERPGTAPRRRRGDDQLARLVAVVGSDLDPFDDPGILGRRVAVTQRQLRLRQPPTRARFVVGPIEHLTDRETALLRLLPGDLTQRELGVTLHMSFNTVKAYNRQIYRKLGVTSRDDAVAAARAHGLL
jgi:DNA-binding CsgD family transcriptional regulator